jgi:hypothetical protein
MGKVSVSLLPALGSRLSARARREPRAESRERDTGRFTVLVY